MYHRVLITEDMISRAKKKAAELPDSRHSFMNWERHVVGFVGQEIFEEVFPMGVISSGNNVYNYDYILGKRKVEVKTKMCSTVPTPDYECSIYTYYQQKPDYYFFIRVFKKNGKFPYGWLLGYTSIEDFNKNKYLVKANTKQSNSLTTRVSTWNVKIKTLTPISNILNRM